MKVNKSQQLTYMNTIKDTKTSNATEHELNAKCFTNCAEWKLSIIPRNSISDDSMKNYPRSDSQPISITKALFYKESLNPILNNLTIIDNLSGINKNSLASLDNKAFNKKNLSNDENFDYANLQLPYQMGNILLGDKSSTVFLVVDLPRDFDCQCRNDCELASKTTATNKSMINEWSSIDSPMQKKCKECNCKAEVLSNLSEVDEYFHEKDWKFMVNGLIHEKRVFNENIEVKVEHKRILKSIQSRLEQYSKELSEKKAKSSKANPNQEFENKKFTFFAKVQNQRNLGVLFSIPDSVKKIDDLPFRPEMVNSSGIKILKYFIEINTPLPSNNGVSAELHKESADKSHFSSSSTDEEKAKRLSSGSRKDSSSMELKKNVSSGSKTFFNPEDQSIYSPKIQYQDEYSSDESKVEFKRRHMFLSKYNGCSNFSIFSKACVPYLASKISRRTTLRDIVACFDRCSANGLEMTLFQDSLSENMNTPLSLKCNTITKYNGKLINALMHPTLSDMELVFSKEKFGNLEDLMTLLKSNNEARGISSSDETHEFRLLDEGLRIRICRDTIKVNFSERSPVHARLTLSDKLERIFSLLDISDKEIEASHSFLSVLWTVSRCENQQLQNNSFLVFYELEFDMNLHEAVYQGKLKLIGILPLRLDHLWFSQINPITKGKQS